MRRWVGWAGEDDSVDVQAKTYDSWKEFHNMRPAEIDVTSNVWVQRLPIKEWYSIQDVCTILDMGGPSVYGAIKRGSMKAYRVNGVVNVKHTDLVRYIDRRKGEAVTDVSGFVIEEIIPEKAAGKALAEDFDVEGEDAAVTGEELDFLKQ